MTSPSSAAAAAAAHLSVLYRCDHQGRLVAVNQWDGGPVPRVHLLRGGGRVCARYRQDLAAPLVADLAGLVDREDPDPRQPLRHLRAYRACLAPVSAVRQGLGFRPPERWPMAGGVRVVDLHAGNAERLRQYMADWLPDVGRRRPMVAALVDGAAVAVCASARMGRAAHEAGVEVAPGLRNRGLGRAVVLAWAQRVQALGAWPLYSTTPDNLASRALATSLGYRCWGTELLFT